MQSLLLILSKKFEICFRRTLLAHIRLETEDRPARGDSSGDQNIKCFSHITKKRKRNLKRKFWETEDGGIPNGDGSCLATANDGNPSPSVAGGCSSSISVVGSGSSVVADMAVDVGCEAVVETVVVVVDVNHDSCIGDNNDHHVLLAYVSATER